MLRFFATMILFSISPISVIAQVPAAPQKSPKEVIEEFWRVETGGERLTTEGWYRTSRYFISLSPGSPPPEKILHVIRNSASDTIEETARTENWAEVLVTTNQLGQIDSTLRFRSTQQHGPLGVLILKGPVLQFHLVLTEKHWMLNRDGSRSSGQTGPPEWLIDCTESAPWINPDAAIRYVTDARSKTADPTLRKNADQTLAKLKKLR